MPQPGLREARTMKPDLSTGVWTNRAYRRRQKKQLQLQNLRLRFRTYNGRQRMPTRSPFKN